MHYLCNTHSCLFCSLYYKVLYVIKLQIRAYFIFRFLGGTFKLSGVELVKRKFCRKHVLLICYHSNSHSPVIVYLSENERHLLPVNPSGFRGGYRTKTELLNITENIKRALDKNMAVLPVGLHYFKAFDILYHSLLCTKFH